MMANGGFGFRREYNGLFDCVKKVIKNEGFGGFYRGFLINSAIQVIFIVSYF